jgi:thiol-disulfide isomerase/thioredoxin
MYPVIGFLIWLVFRKKINKKWLKISTLLASVLIPFFAYFAFNPIYSGDFSNNSELLKVKSELDDYPSPKLIVVSIPNCPYCQESVGRMIELKKRFPKLNVEYLICVNDSLAEKAIESYQELSQNKLSFKQAKEGEKLGNMVHMSFPTFVLISDTQKLMWSNDNFGVGALDEVVETFDK